VSQRERGKEKGGFVAQMGSTRGLLIDLGKQEVALGDVLGSATQQLNEEDK
jgi:hypothetical protein